MENQSIDKGEQIKTNPKKGSMGITLMLMVLFIMSLTTSVFLYFQNSKLKSGLPLENASPEKTNQEVTYLPLNPSTSPNDNNQEKWPEARHGMFSFEYPTGWHVAELWQENIANNGIFIAIDPKPISTAPRGGPISTFGLAVFSGKTNPDEILEEKIDEFKNSGYYKGEVEETIDADYGKIYHFKGKITGEYMNGAETERYFLTLNKNPQDLINQRVIVASLDFSEDAELSNMLRKIVLSIKDLSL